MQKKRKRISWKLSADQKELIIRVDVQLLLGLVLGPKVNLDTGEGVSSTMNMAIRLTKREQDVLPFLLTGKSNKEVATELNLTERTVKFHASQIYNKIGVSGRHELMHFLLSSSSNTKGEHKNEESISVGSSTGVDVGGTGVCPKGNGRGQENNHGRSNGGTFRHTNVECSNDLR